MDKVSFQNGFIAGMATKGLVRSGEYYKPRCWNDEGVYDYFYIDFGRKVEEFSQGMWDESVIVWDSGRLPVSGIEYVSPGVYKIKCNISNCVLGVNVMSKKTGILSFATGEAIPVFSVSFNVAGMDTYLRVKYAYDETTFDYFMTPNEIPYDITIEDSFDMDSICESANFIDPTNSMVVNEIVPTVVLI